MKWNRTQTTRDQKPNRVDAFGAENLEEIVETVLDETDASLSYSITGSEIKLSFRQGAGPKPEVGVYEVFEGLFNPEEGYLREMEDIPDFRFNRVTSFPLGWGTDYRDKTEEVYIEGEQIQTIQNLSKRDSFTEGYSAEKFRELYEEAIK